MSDESSEIEKRFMTPVHEIAPEMSRQEKAKIMAQAAQEAYNLLFVKGLYSAASISTSTGKYLENALRRNEFSFDAYCKSCKRETTFRTAAFNVHSRGTGTRARPNEIVVPPSLLSINATCQRDFAVYSYILKFEKDQVIKIGQWPSTADVAFGELRSIDKTLDDIDRKELGTALGLHAHDTAIGAFVYLRRVFERMVERAHQRQSDAGKPVDGFYKMRMDERVAALKDELPEKAVQNSAVFSVLSVGVHELTEQQCKKFFPILKAVLFQMLEQEEHKRKAAITSRETDAAFQAILNELSKTDTN